MSFPVFLCLLRLFYIKYPVCYTPRLLVPGSPVQQRDTYLPAFASKAAAWRGSDMHIIFSQQTVRKLQKSDTIQVLKTYKMLEMVILHYMCNKWQVRGESRSTSSFNCTRSNRQISSRGIEGNVEKAESKSEAEQWVRAGGRQRGLP